MSFNCTLRVATFPLLAALLAGPSSAFTPVSIPLGGQVLNFSGRATTGDFNGDGYPDLALTSYSPTAVLVYLWTGSGFTLDETISGPSYTGWGVGLGAGDFDGDGRDELAIGATSLPLESDPSLKPGAVLIWERTSAGGWFQSKRFAEADVAAGEAHHTGYALAAGDFDGNGYDDLAYACVDHPVSGVAGAGQVHVVFGSSPHGLDAAGESRAPQVWHQDVFGLPDAPEPADQLGQVLVAGDFDGSGRADLAIGVPSEDLDGQTNAGAVHVLYGTGSGLSTGNNDFIRRGLGGVGGDAQTYESFGFSLAASPTGLSTAADSLAVGAPGASGVQSAVEVFDGGVGGLDLGSSSTETLWGGALCGYSIALGDPMWSQRRGVVMAGCPGTVSTDPGSVQALQRDGASWHFWLGFYSDDLAEGAPQPTDKLGSSVLMADFDQDGFDDVALFMSRAGHPWTVLVSSFGFADGFESGDTSAWSSP